MKTKAAKGSCIEAKKYIRQRPKLQQLSTTCMVKAVYRKSAKNTEFGTDGFSEIGLRCIMFMEILTP